MTVTTAALSPITSPVLQGIRHGFFTRRGGASSGVFEGLNCGYGSSDLRDIVTVNRERVAGEMGVAASQLTNAHQTHSARALTLTEPLPADKPEADALVTATPGLALAVLTADCQPVLFADPEAGVIGAAHAGWRGAMGGVLEATIDAMCTLGATPATIRAAIGPSISQKAYEVGEEFLETFIADDPGNTRYFANGAASGKYQFDLPGYGLSRLRDAGLTEVTWTGHCTYCDPELFFSYRRSCHAGEADYGRMLASIRL